ncbi:MAG: arginine--tRNA ligase, partial [Chloroflexi bacterium]|nr:arginine--tRNA ligase [Chloroflexota bacterium]
MQDYLNDCILSALESLGGVPADFTLEFQQPANPDHGDLACNVAMKLAKHFRKAPRQIAEEIRDALDAQPLDPDRISEVQVAGPGFMNFRFSDKYLLSALADILQAGEQFGHTRSGEGKTALV